MVGFLGAADDRVRGGQDGLAQHDQGEQAVALGDVLGMPRGGGDAFGEHGHRQVGQRDHYEQGYAQMFRCEEPPTDPCCLDDGDTRDVAQAGGAHGRIADGRAHPLAARGDTHEHIAADGDAEVGTGHRSLDPGRDSERPGHLDDHRQAVQPVVGVEGTGEPGEVHPGPPDGEEADRVPDESLGEMALGPEMVEGSGGAGDRDHEDEVEKQF